MKWFLFVKHIIRQLRANALSSFFILMSMMLGIAVLIVAVAIANGTQARILDRTDRVGLLDTFTLRTGAWGQGGGGMRSDRNVFLLDIARVERLMHDIDGIAAAWPVLNTRADVSTQTDSLSMVMVQGILEQSFWFEERPLASGRTFYDDETSPNEAVIGHALATSLFFGTDPIGKSILVEERLFEVVGVLEPLGATGSGRNADETVIIKDADFLSLFSPPGVSSVTVRITDPALLDKVAQETKSYLEGIYGREIFVRLPMAQAQARDEMSDSLTFYLILAAAAAFLIGGTVMMQIISASIDRRKKEIGIFKALGAKNRQIATQILVECLVMAGFGGVIGIVIGRNLARFIGEQLGLRVVFLWYEDGLGLLAALIIALAFGVAPAKRAAGLDPVVCLEGEVV